MQSLIRAPAFPKLSPWFDARTRASARARALADRAPELLLRAHAPSGCDDTGVSARGNGGVALRLANGPQQREEEREAQMANLQAEKNAALPPAETPRAPEHKHEPEPEPQPVALQPQSELQLDRQPGTGKPTAERDTVRKVDRSLSSMPRSALSSREEAQALLLIVSSSDEDDGNVEPSLPSEKPTPLREMLQLEFVAGPLGFALSRDQHNVVTAIHPAEDLERNANPAATVQLRVGDELIRVGTARAQRSWKLVAAQIKSHPRPVTMTFKRTRQMALRGPSGALVACTHALVIGRGVLGLAIDDEDLSHSHSIIKAVEGDGSFVIEPQGECTLLIRRANGEIAASWTCASTELREGDSIYLGKEEHNRQVCVEIVEEAQLAEPPAEVNAVQAAPVAAAVAEVRRPQSKSSLVCCAARPK